MKMTWLGDGKHARKRQFTTTSIAPDG